MSLNQEERIAIVTYRLEKAERAFLQAKSNVPMQFWEVIANRMYYAAYYAVSALLIANGHTANSLEQGRLYNKLFTLRLTGDYNDHYNLDEQDVLPLIDPTEQLIDDVSALAKASLYA